MLWVAMLALVGHASLDLSSVQSEPKLEKRSELALEYANKAIDKAKAAYQDGRLPETETALKDVQDAVQLSYDSLMATGKDPRKKSGAFKGAEKATREMLRRLSGLRDLMVAADHTLVDPVVTKVTDIHDKLLMGVMGGK